jgi:bifunctional NMN adenylyltransferase/nudix hydrolase
MANKKDVAVYIGRFNPFHLGHAYVLEQALKNYKLVIVLVGSAGKSRSPKNPFTFAERKEMIEQWEQTVDHGSTLSILPVRDFASNNSWIKSVQATVRSNVRSVATRFGLILNDVYITGSARDDSTWYLKAFPQWKQDLVPPLQHNPGQDDDLSATSVRQVLYESELTKVEYASLQRKLPVSTLLWVQTFFKVEPEVLSRLRIEYKTIKENKAKWDGSPFPPTFMCADAVIIQSGHVLMVRRANQPGRGLWALPGGYVNQHERVRDAAVREAEEETGIRLTTGKNAVEITKKMLDGAIRDKEFFDDPNRSERGRTFTMAFLMRLDDTRPLPQVSGQKIPYYEWAEHGITDGNAEDAIETFEADWKTLEWVQTHSEEIFEDHSNIIEWAESHIDD